MAKEEISQNEEQLGETVEPLTEKQRLREELQNREIPGTKEAQDFDQLYEALKAVGQVEGSSKTYSSEELISAIDGFRKGELTATMITSTGKLREIAVKLKGQDILKRQESEGSPVIIARNKIKMEMSLLDKASEQTSSGRGSVPVDVFVNRETGEIMAIGNFQNVDPQIRAASGELTFNVDDNGQIGEITPNGPFSATAMATLEESKRQWNANQPSR